MKTKFKRLLCVACLLFAVAIPVSATEIDTAKDVCSDDTIENASSACSGWIAYWGGDSGVDSGPSPCCSGYRQVTKIYGCEGKCVPATGTMIQCGNCGNVLYMSGEFHGYAH